MVMKRQVMSTPSEKSSTEHPAMRTSAATRQHGRILIAGLVGLAVGVGGLTTFGQGEPPRPRVGESTTRPDLPKAVVGSDNCKNCHAHPENFKTYLDAGRLLCRMTEYPVWNGHDKHKDA